MKHSLEEPVIFPRWKASNMFPGGELILQNSQVLFWYVLVISCSNYHESEISPAKVMLGTKTLNCGWNLQEQIACVWGPGASGKQSGKRADGWRFTISDPKEGRAWFFWCIFFRFFRPLNCFLIWGRGEFWLDSRVGDVLGRRGGSQRPLLFIACSP